MALSTASDNSDSRGLRNVAALIVMAPADRGERVVSETATLESVLRQDRPPRLIVVVETSPETDQGGPVDITDETFARLSLADTLVDPSLVILRVSAAGAQKFGTAIEAALEQTPAVGDRTWLWMLHDDMVAHPTALSALLEVAKHSPNVGAVGPKQVRYGEPEKLLEMGIDATATARRVYRLEPDEIDQGQHDGREEVLAVGTAGMVVRQTAWRQVGGLNPALGPFGDGLEFGRRLWRCGYRVVVAPGAVVEHVQASYDHESDGQKSYARRRAAQLYNWAMALPTWQIVPFIFWLPFFTLMRVFGRLTLRQPQLVPGEVRGFLLFVGMVPSVRSSRAELARLATEPRQILSSLESDPALLYEEQRNTRRIRASGTDETAALDEGALNALRVHRMRSAAAFWAMMAVAVILSLFTWYPYRMGVTGSLWGALPLQWSTLMAQAWSGWQISGDGAVGPSSPLLLPLSILSAPFALVGVPPTRFAEFLIYAALPLAAWGGWGVASSFTRSLAIRVGAGSLWASVGALIVSLLVGNLGAILMVLALPGVLVGLLRGLCAPTVLVARGVGDVVMVPVRDRLAWLGFAGLCSIVVIAAAPIMVLLLPLFTVLLAIVPDRRWDDGGGLAGLTSPGRLLRGVAVGLVTVPGLVLILPTLLSTLTRTGWGGLAQWLTLPAGQPAGMQILLGWPLAFSAGESFAEGQLPALVLVLSVVSGLVMLVWASAAVYAATTRRSSLMEFTIGAWITAIAFLALALVQASLVPGAKTASVALLAGYSLALLVTISTAYSGFSITAPALVHERHRDQVWLRGVPGTIGAVAGVVTVVALLIMGPLTLEDERSGAQEEESGTQSIETATALVVDAPDVSDDAAEGLSSLSSSPFLRSASVPRVPVIVQEAQQGPRAARLLTLTMQEGEVRATLMRGAGVQLADLNAGNAVEMTEAEQSARDTLVSAVATLTAQPNVRVAQTLAAHAVDIVVLSASSEDFSLIRTIIDATAGMERIGVVEGSLLWRVRPSGTVPARVSVIDDGGGGSGGVTLMSTPVDSGPLRVSTHYEGDGGVLVLAETVDPGWHVTFDGQVLERAADPDSHEGWRQAFVLPGGSGQLDITYRAGYLWWWWIASGAALITVAAAALPLRARPSRYVSAESTAEELVPIVTFDDNRDIRLTYPGGTS